jgi:hypothetical protein
MLEALETGKYDGPLSSFAFKFNLRRYIMDAVKSGMPRPAAGAYTRPLFNST